MFLNSAQIQELKAIFASIGINNSKINRYVNINNYDGYGDE